MQIARLELKNFRSILDESFELPSLSFLVGRNDAGKSNVLEAVRLLLEGAATDVKREDFYNPDQPIELIATLTGVRAYLDLLDDKNRPRVEQRISAEGELKVRRTTAEGRLRGIELYNPQTREFEIVAGLDAPLKAFLPEPIFIGALADAREQAKGTHKDALGRLISQVVARIEDAVDPVLDNAYREADAILNVSVRNGREVDRRVPQLIDIENEINSYVQDTFSNASVRLTVTLPSVRTILGSISLKVREADSDDPYFRRGNGFQRTLYLSLLRALANRIRAAERGTVRPFVLLFEEPEAFLHPNFQAKMRDALKAISADSQVIISTHSSIMVTPDLLPNAVRLHKQCVVDHPKPFTRRIGPLKESELTGDQRQLLPLFSIQRSSRFLFSRGVVLVEGVGEEHLVPAIARSISNFQIGGQDVAVIETGGKDKLVPFSQILAKLGLRTWMLTDLDFLWDGAGRVFGADHDHARFCQELIRFAPAPVEPTEAARRQNKRQRIEACTRHLQNARNNLCDRLAAMNIFVLREGEIEEYVGLIHSTKHRYLAAAQEIIAGTRQLVHPEELRAIVAALEHWCGTL